MRHLVVDTAIMAQRNLKRIPRDPALALGFTVQPIMFVLLFRYVFGGAIHTEYSNYADFLMPGIIVQSISFGGFVTALGLNEDLHKGLIDRFRSLPMARAAVLAGRTLSDVVTNTISIGILVATGLVVGFSFNTTVPEAVAGVLLLLLFGFAFSWFFAYVGLIMSTPESANSVAFIAVFPLTFISSAFVPIQTFPTVLRDFAKVNPFTLMVNAMRHLWEHGPGVGTSNIWWALLWIAGILIVCAPIAVARYRRATGS
jgi:ABC transporter DrrB family efflux protein